MKIIIGPYFCASPGATPEGPVSPLNVCVEWSGVAQAVRLPLFQAHHEGMSKVYLHHIVVRHDKVPFDVVCPEYQVLETSGGTFIPLDAVLAAVYRNNEVDRDMREVLQELGEFVSLQNSTHGHLPKGDLLLPAAEQAGFRLVNLLREGDEVLAEIGWHPSNSINQFHTTNCRFRVQRGAIIEDCWIMPEKVVCISSLLAKEFHDSFPGSPRALLTRVFLEHVVSLVTQD